MLPCLSALRIHDVCPTEMPKRDRAEAELDAYGSSAKVTRREVEEAPAAEAEAAATESEGEEEVRDVQLLVLDFDGTMTTDYFQPRKGGERMRASSMNTQTYLHMDKEEHYSLYGGREVVEKMRRMFHELRKGLQLRILSYGNKEAIVKSLETVRLIKYFTSPGGTPGDMVFGKDVPPLNEAEDVYKAFVIQEWIDELDLLPDEVAFVDNERAAIDEPEKGEGNQGAAQVLAPGHAHLHTGDNFLASADWISDVCGIRF